MDKIKKTIIEYSKSVKGRKILSTIAVTFSVCMFYIWLTVGLYLNLPKEHGGDFLPFLLMYIIFPMETIAFAARKIYVVYTKGYEDTLADEE